MSARNILDAMTFTRASTAYRVNPLGVMELMPVDRLRADYVPVTKALVRMLLERAATNLLLRSEEINNAAWGNALLTVSANAALAPNGTMTADKLVEGTGTIDPRTGQSVTGQAVGALFTFSCFFKAGERNFVQLEINDGAGTNRVKAIFDLSNGTIALPATNDGNASGAVARIRDFGGGIYRCSISGSPSSAGTTKRAQIRLRNSAVDAPYAADGTSGLFAWGAQLEAGNYATSYIPTTSAQVTRSADELSITGTDFSEWFNGGAGTVFIEIVPQARDISAATTSLVLLNDGTGFNFMNIRKTAGSAGINMVAVSGGVTQVNGPVLPLDADQLTRMAFAFAPNDFVLAKDGVVQSPDTSGTVPTVNQALFQGFGHYSAIRFFPTRLTDAELAALTAL